MTDEPHNHGDTDDEELIEQARERLERPVFNPQLVPIQLDENTIHIRAGPWTGPVYTITDIDEDDVITQLLSLIDGETAVDDIFASFDESQRGEVARVLLALAEKHAAYDAEAADGPMYSHLMLKTEFGQRERRRLDEQSVLVVDDSRMGEYVVEDLLEVGIDRVAYADLRDRGPPRGVGDADGYSAVDADDLYDSIDAADFVVVTTDGPSAVLQEVNEHAIDTETPWVVGQIRGFDGIVGPAIFPGETACYECFHQRMLSNVTNIPAYSEFEDRQSDDDLAVAGLPMFSRAIAGYLSLDLLHLLAFGIGYTSGRVVTVNSLDLSMEVNEVLKLPRCDACGRDSSIDTSRFITLDDMVKGSRLQSEGR